MKTKFQVLRKIAAEMGIEIKIARTGDKSKVGVHRLYPNMEDMYDALDVAERDNFQTIFIHNTNTWNRN